MQKLQKLMIRTIPLLVLLLLGSVEFAHAQNVSVMFGVGTATDSQNTVYCADSGLAGETATCYDPSVPGVVNDGELGPAMGGAFGIFGAQFMFFPKLGVSGEYAFRFAQAPYAQIAQINYRPGFYDFNAVYVPLTGGDRRVVPEFQAGIGGADVKYYEVFSGSLLSNTGAYSESEYSGVSSDHFQLHLGAAVRLYVKGNIFVRPAFDFHYVTSFNQEFGRDTVTQYTVAVGYTFGSR